MAKKTDELEGAESTEEVVSEATPRLRHDFLREDLNELRDVVNELYRKVCE